MGERKIRREFEGNAEGRKKGSRKKTSGKKKIKEI